MSIIHSCVIYLYKINKNESIKKILMTAFLRLKKLILFEIFFQVKFCFFIVKDNGDNRKTTQCQI